MTNSNSDRPSEFELIAELFAPLAEAPGALKLTDDAALVSPPAGHELVITTDALVEGVHFLAEDPALQIARKALRVNLSDLAAKGAEAAGYLLALSLPSGVTMDWLRQFAEGLKQDQREFAVSLYGGDTTATPGPLTIAITAFGFVPKGKMIRRSGARPDDLVFVSGTVGDGGAGLALLREHREVSHAVRDFLIDRYREPRPRLALGQALRGIAHAALDVSDGLLADLGHIAETSNVRIEVDAHRLPLSAALQAVWGASDEARARAATAGDDYEIAFTVAPRFADDAVKAARYSTAITEIGRVTAGQGVVLLDGQGREIPVPAGGYTHF
ncbi:MAG TPA: thiamine-phosphate kinase [Rhizomicrobium sp.]|nr:thiamine-phosphate kinase [Rhizomicrobium sp.]